MEKTKSLSRALRISKDIQGVAGTAYKVCMVQSIDGDTMQACVNRENESIELTHTLVDSMTNAELAFTIAHEVAHYVNDDKRRLERKGEEYTKMLVDGISENNAKLKERGHGFLYRAICNTSLAAIGMAGGYLTLRQEGQKYESEADELALQYMQEAGYDAHAAISALRKLHGGELLDFGLWNSLILSVTSTHPLPRDREEGIKKKLRED
ncbi:MAG: M48 family metalloprotease [Candidatus Micrarchaeaceae archaeon]|jgi:Zn-dependent protease with chaperone function|nr:M48 family metalloprotease [Candidatus Micrarchaeota archaeon]HII10040.1 M48 family metalloprotease [Candidatus Micrarchaeota archaeon]